MLSAMPRTDPLADEKRRRYQRPEGELIAERTKQRGWSGRRLARRLGISQTRLSAIVNGYESTGTGTIGTVSARADILARIAIVLRITPAELAAVGREDAAQRVEEIAGHRAPNPVREAILDDGRIRSERDRLLLLTIYEAMIAPEPDPDDDRDGDEAGVPQTAGL